MESCRVREAATTIIGCYTLISVIITDAQIIQCESVTVPSNSISL